MSNRPRYACPQCGATEFITSPNSWDKYEAVDGNLLWQSSEVSNDEFKLYCRECGKRAPSDFEFSCQ